MLANSADLQSWLTVVADLPYFLRAKLSGSVVVAVAVVINPAAKWLGNFKGALILHT